MIAKAIDRILQLAAPEAVEINGESYTAARLHRVENELRAEPIVVSTLSSLVKYLKDFDETWSGYNMLVHVCSPTRVEVMTALDADRQREYLIIANAEIPQFPFGKYVDNENFLIAVQAMTVEDATTDKALVLKFAGTVTSGSIKEYGDDGVTQKAVVKNGIKSLAEAIVPSPCNLRPYRTFIEVVQPASSFVFRMREGRDNTVESALFEADGGAWKNEARDNIREYLENALKDTGIVVIS